MTVENKKSCVIKKLDIKEDLMGCVIVKLERDTPTLFIGLFMLVVHLKITGLQRLTVWAKTVGNKDK